MINLSDDFFAQTVGVLASLFVIAAYGFKHDDVTKRITMGGSILFVIHFLMMGAFAAMAVTVINIIRVWLSIRYHGHTVLCAFFVITYMGIGALTFEYLIDIFAIMAPIMGCIAMYCFKGVRFRALCLVATMSWLIYGVLIGSIGVVLTQAVVSAVNITTIYRLKIENKI
jgi:hypothetical protein